VKDKVETKEQLLGELAKLRQRVTDVQGRLRLLGAAEAEEDIHKMTVGSLKQRSAPIFP
jgi:hypothetical protein